MEYKHQVKVKEDLYEKLKNAFALCSEAIMLQNKLYPRKRIVSKKFEKLHCQCETLLISYEQYNEEMIGEIKKLNDMVESKWSAFEKTWRNWSEHGVVVFAQKKMNWWECGNIVTQERIAMMQKKLKEHNVQGSTLSIVSKKDIMDVFGIRNFNDSTKLYDAIQVLFQQSTAAPPNIPEKFFCPICCEKLVDPVIALDGKTYCRFCIENWIVDRKSNPMSPQGKRLTTSKGVLHLCSNSQLQQEILNFFMAHPHLKLPSKEKKKYQTKTKDQKETELKQNKHLIKQMWGRRDHINFILKCIEYFFSFE
ncbi:WD repeat, SAM and U-box domain containing 1 [Reticulomyxa filosa]|uniref:WD repeat, SAM and U-box domain containing 1 n=1 Tax=Reticulomyxa filosa TaxID=46433 RepID=X6MIU8_RETFI|nr:WD repeat, SAM and U-box domain containing 1 [Reticulomyxa filosa]|eukprot:ETO13908.1 WD repeat, SAM and U-box domain containing 1 [Reticulomyxa filosa]